MHCGIHSDFIFLDGDASYLSIWFRRYRNIGDIRMRKYCARIRIRIRGI